MVRIRCRALRLLLVLEVLENVIFSDAFPLFLRWPSQKRATQEVSRARRLGISLRELPVSVSRRRIQHDPAADSVQQSPGSEGNRASTTDVEGGVPARTRRDNRLNMKKIAECREKSQSAWLHFPHVELVFLLFAFEGAVAAQVAALRENFSPVVFILAMSSLVSECWCSRLPQLAFCCPTSKDLFQTEQHMLRGVRSSTIADPREVSLSVRFFHAMFAVPPSKKTNFQGCTTSRA